MKKRVFLLAGASGAGKSTLCAALLRLQQHIVKTQAPEYHGFTAIDLPGEYVTHPRWRTAFLTNAEGAERILVVVPADKRNILYPGDMFKIGRGVRVAGVVTKIDSPKADIAAARKELMFLGITEPVFETAVCYPETLIPLREWLGIEGKAIGGCA